MTDQTNVPEREDAQALAIRANVKTELARLDHEERLQMAQMARNMPVPLRVMFDPNMHERVQKAAAIMAEARGFTPVHLCGKTEACFAVVTKALTWGMDPWAVAASTFQTPDGKVGYEGKLIQAIIEGSGKLAKPIGQGEYFGDWSKIEGNFKIVKKPTKSGGEYDAPVPNWTFFGPDEEGLGVRYEVHLKGQEQPLKFEMLLKQAFPRNATTWPTRPKQQLHYAAMRALGNVVCPSLIMGVPSRDDMGDDGPPMRDVTPPKAPPPVDLKSEGIHGTGRMTVEDEAAQDGGPKTAERFDPETGEVMDTAQPEEKPKRHRRTKAEMEAARRAEAEAKGGESNVPAGESPAAIGAGAAAAAPANDMIDRGEIPTTNPGRPVEAGNGGAQGHRPPPEGDDDEQDDDDEITNLGI